jgi:hypothetical protein
MCSKGKHKTGTMAIVNDISFYDEMTMSGRCTFSDSSNEKLSVYALSDNPE